MLTPTTRPSSGRSGRNFRTVSKNTNHSSWSSSAVVKRPAVSSRIASRENHQSQLRVPAVPRTFGAARAGRGRERKPRLLECGGFSGGGRPDDRVPGQRVQRGTAAPAAELRALQRADRRLHLLAQGNDFRATIGSNLSGLRGREPKQFAFERPSTPAACRRRTSRTTTNTRIARAVTPTAIQSGQLQQQQSAQLSALTKTDAIANHNTARSSLKRVACVAGLGQRLERLSAARTAVGSASPNEHEQDQAESEATITAISKALLLRSTPIRSVRARVRSEFLAVPGSCLLSSRRAASK